MLSYQTPATIKAANTKAEEVTGRKLVGHGVDRASFKGTRSESLAKAHAAALERRKAG